ncbi:Phosphoribosyl 1,2-cyclic phosphodiesterase [Thiothrix caldifontis]|uniref:Phosphoribosyl 1,2-cyclic phosphodiesterase n=1 Tax=Thiothrix caldifontis TaxID=525918 RepID=A0A1H4GFI1_9GAMM|nr:MBL fold metallo-hydrolase [Thiothrix caldifontis]SEB07648.1 Phosphoribosyl 1,2-cyclic phosphodiesterase [Thiothrix caldifontis]
MLRFASLGSGSKGNGTLIESGKTRILLDCGFTLGETERRLYRLGCPPQSLTAILITHEHGDHAAGVGRLSRRYNIPVWLTVGTYHAMRDTNFAHTHYINVHQALEIQDLQVIPFPVPHDAREPCQFVFGNGCRKLGILTDVGSHTPLILQMLQRLDALMLECNYDAMMLANGAYPPSLKARVAGRYGHLDNNQSTYLLEQLDLSQLQHLIGMHLSENNNLPDYAYQALCAGVGCEQGWIQLANQTDGLGWCEIH